MKPKVVSIYSGGGGIDCGFDMAGFDICISTDNWPVACETLKLNGLSRKVICGDIREIDFIEQLGSIGIEKGEVDCLVGGPPCPAYSKSRFYRTDKKRALEDENSFTLYQYFRALEDLDPKTFFFENVPGFTFKPHKPALDLLKSEAERLGYDIRFRVLNAADYGVPQKRERFICVGVKKGNAPFVFPETTHYDPQAVVAIPFDKSPWATCRDAIGDLDRYFPGDESLAMSPKYIDLLKEIPPGDNYLYFTAERGYKEPKYKWRSRYWSYLLKLSPDLPSWTIQASFSNNMGPFHWNNRYLRINEIKRIQTFDDNYEITGAFKDQWRQVGNAVPPLLASVIAKAMMKQYYGDLDD